MKQSNQTTNLSLKITLEDYNASKCIQKRKFQFRFRFNPKLLRCLKRMLVPLTTTAVMHVSVMLIASINQTYAFSLHP